MSKIAFKKKTIKSKDFYTNVNLCNIKDVMVGNIVVGEALPCNKCKDEIYVIGYLSNDDEDPKKCLFSWYVSI